MLVLSPICCVPAGDVSSPPSTATAANEAPSSHGQCNQSQFHAAGFSLRVIKFVLIPIHEQGDVGNKSHMTLRAGRHEYIVFTM
ncbi:hypothetical protein AMELA_G00053530 [Ameiurus melas]|uniref:Uncharacterized protein n=1 Tax=Ameiurus melas TaxID=219545 RepID=A0A7J6B6G0_AMEME|nr:hypothetical protein AMELA_G00053530 [Ameiurus melas]